jgi:hypothetical protein
MEELAKELLDDELEQLLELDELELELELELMLLLKDELLLESDELLELEQFVVAGGVNGVLRSAPHPCKNITTSAQDSRRVSVSD